MRMPKFIKKHPVWWAFIGLAIFLLWTLPEWLGNVWPLFSIKTLPDWISEHQPLGIPTNLAAWSTWTIGIVLTILFVALVYVTYFGPNGEWLAHKTIKQQAGLITALEQQLRQANADLQQRTNEKEGALQSYQICKQNFALFRFERFADDTRDWNVHVIVRLSDNADFPLAEEIERLLRDRAKWAVKLDKSNSPILRPSKEFKVVLVTKRHDRFMRVRDFLDDLLLPCRVGLRTDGDEDESHLVVEVLPTIKGMMH